MTKIEVHVCPMCGRTTKKYWQRLSPGLVHALVKFYAVVCAKGMNCVHVSTEVNLTKTEYNNFQKLRYHGLVYHYKTNGQTKDGYWLITHRGAQFLHGEIQIPARVLTYNNEVVEHDSRLVMVKDVIGETPYFDDIDTIEYEPGSVDVSENIIQFDRSGQGFIGDRPYLAV